MQSSAFAQRAKAELKSVAPGAYVNARNRSSFEKLNKEDSNNSKGSYILTPIVMRGETIKCLLSIVLLQVTVFGKGNLNSIKD